jgi:predicted phosphoadenosine phosphosulfate sulfurtransferase
MMTQASWFESTLTPLAEAKLSKIFCASSSLPFAISHGKDSGIHLQIATKIAM